jgi:hypothetical protein
MRAAESELLPKAIHQEYAKQDRVVEWLAGTSKALRAN